MFIWSRFHAWCSNHHARQKHTTWWSFFLAGCPDQPPETAAFEDDASTSDLMGSMAAWLLPSGSWSWCHEKTPGDYYYKDY